MGIPPRDHFGRVVPHDDCDLGEDDGVIRNIPLSQIVYDENIQGRRISSGAFSATSGDPDNGMSVDLENLIVAAGKAPSANVPEGMGAVRLHVGPVRGVGLKVGSDPDDSNPFHGQVWGVKKPLRSKLHDLVVDWVVAVDGVRIR